jgi:hypothetical protein
MDKTAIGNAIGCRSLLNRTVYGQAFFESGPKYNQIQNSTTIVGWLCLFLAHKQHV